MKLCYKVAIPVWMKQTSNDYGNASRKSYCSTYFYKSFLSFTDMSQQTCAVNKRWYSLVVATQASDNSKLYLMMFWKMLSHSLV